MTCPLLKWGLLFNINKLILMYVLNGYLWGITRDSKTGKEIHRNSGRCDFDEIKPGQIAIRTLYTNWKIK